MVLALAVSPAASGQTVTNTAFKSGESLKYVASFYMSSLWTDVAEIKMEVSDIRAANRELYRLLITAATYQSWDSYFRVRYLFEAYADKVSLRPFVSRRSVEEGTYTKSARNVFRWDEGRATATIQRRRRPEKTVDVAVPDGAHDLVSALYLARNLDFASKRKGARTELKVLVDDAVRTVVVFYEGAETLDVAGLGKKQCHKVSVGVPGDKSLIKNALWITADRNRLPVLITAEVPVGSFQVKLVETRGLRN